MATPTSFKGLVDTLLGLINLLVPALFTIIFLFIVWKIIDAWVLNAADEQKRTEGRQLIITAVIVLTLMLVTWAIVAVLRASLFGA